MASDRTSGHRPAAHRRGDARDERPGTRAAPAGGQPGPAVIYMSGYRTRSSISRSWSAPAPPSCRSRSRRARWCATWMRCCGRASPCGTRRRNRLSLDGLVTESAIPYSRRARRAFATASYRSLPGIARVVLTLGSAEAWAAGLVRYYRSVVQPGARRHGIAGIYGNGGIVESATYRI